jgi:hypothetical protein
VRRPRYAALLPRRRFDEAARGPRTLRLVVRSSPRAANTARSTLANAYGTLSADQKPRSVSRDNAPSSTRPDSERCRQQQEDRPSEPRRPSASEPRSAPAVSKQLSRSRMQSRRSCGQCRSRFREPSRCRARCRCPRPSLRARVPKQRCRPVSGDFGRSGVGLNVEKRGRPGAYTRLLAGQTTIGTRSAIALKPSRLDLVGLILEGLVRYSGRTGCAAAASGLPPGRGAKGVEH